MTTPLLEDRYEIRIQWSDEDKAFVAQMPAMPYVGAHGDTHEEALLQAKEAIRAYLALARELGKPIPALQPHQRDDQR